MKRQRKSPPVTSPNSPPCLVFIAQRWRAGKTLPGVERVCVGPFLNRTFLQFLACSRKRVSSPKNPSKAKFKPFELISTRVTTVCELSSVISIYGWNRHGTKDQSRYACRKFG